MKVEMFKRSKSKTNVNSDSRESLAGSSNQSFSNENLLDTRSDRVFDSTASLYRTSHFDVFFLGRVQDVNLGGTPTRDPDVQLIDRVEEAQLEGKISLLPKEEEQMLLSVSKYGVKVMDQYKKEVFQRHPLHTVAQIVYYEDSFFKSNVALKIGQVGRSVYDCYVFQCKNEEQAQNICQCVKDVFDTITGRAP